jgi:hypothetical protein
MNWQVTPWQDWQVRCPVFRRMPGDVEGLTCVLLCGAPEDYTVVIQVVRSRLATVGETAGYVLYTTTVSMKLKLEAADKLSQEQHERMAAMAAELHVLLMHESRGRLDEVWRRAGGEA